MLKCAVQVMRWRDARAHRPAICTRNRCTHYIQSVSNRSWPKPQLILDRSLSHTYAHSAIMVSISFTAILSNSGIWPVTPGINTLLLSIGTLGSFTCSGMTLPIYMGPTALRGIRATGDTLSNVESQVFTPYNFGSSRDRTPDLLT